MLIEYTVNATKLIHKFIEIPSEKLSKEEIYAEIVKSLLPLRNQGFIITEDDIEINTEYDKQENSEDLQTSGSSV